MTTSDSKLLSDALAKLATSIVGSCGTHSLAQLVNREAA
jgi:hypothetical protein